MTTAIVFVPVGHVLPYAAHCLTYCTAKGYEVAGITGDWSAVVDMVFSRAVGVVVVSTAAHLDPRRSPRIEVVAEQETAPGHRRTRVIRRGAAA